MMTREMARKKTCPLRVELGVTLSANLSSENVTAENKIKELISCMAEKCPKWRDLFLNDNPCFLYDEYATCDKFMAAAFEAEYGDNEEYIGDKQLPYWNVYLKTCINCDKHFGRCGG